MTGFGTLQRLKFANEVCTGFVYTGYTEICSLCAMKNITLSAEDPLIEAARARARAENSTLNEQFRRWLASYTQTQERLDRYEAVMGDLRGQLKVGPKLDRASMNER